MRWKRPSRVAEQPFDSERKRMTTVHAYAGPGRKGAGRLPDDLVVGRLVEDYDFVAFTKGAVDSLLDYLTPTCG